jgi:hypothetical protein
MRPTRWNRHPSPRPGRALAGGCRRRGPGWRALALAALVPLLVAGNLAAQVGVQDDCCLLLLVPVGARSSAMGGAITARSGPDAVFRNPAGLVGIDGNAFVVHHADRSMVDVNAFSLVLTPRRAAVGVSYQLFDYGTTRMTDDTGQETGELSYRDHLVVGSVGLPVGAGMAIGANYRFFQERIDCRGACAGAERVTTFHAVDLGYRYVPRWHPALQFGVAAVNLPLQSSEGDAPRGFPARLHVGIAYDVLYPFMTDDVLALRFAVDVQDELRNPGSLLPSTGLELDMQRVLFLRAGYTHGEGLASGAAIGVELRYDRFDIGVSRSFVNSGFEEGEPFQITFGVHF